MKIIDYLKAMAKRSRILFHVYIKYFWRPRRYTLIHELHQLTKNNALTTCLQIGANDGRVNDPIFRLIHKNEWNVAFVEPQTHVFKILKDITYRGNPRHLYFNCAISDKNGLRPFYSIGFSEKRWAHGLSSFLEDSLIKAYDSGYVERCAKLNGETVPENSEDLIKKSMVQCRTFDDVLDEYEDKFNDKLNLLLIDTEGFDYQIIKLFPFNRIRPSIIVYEHHHLSNEEYKESKELLQKYNYQLKVLGNDTLAFTERDVLH